MTEIISKRIMRAQAAPKDKKGIIAVRMKDTNSGEIYDEIIDTIPAKVSMKFINEETKEVFIDTVRVEYDSEHKTAYVSSKTIERYCNKYNAWERPEGTREKYYNIDVDVPNNDALQYIFIYQTIGGIMEMTMEIDLMIETGLCDELFVECEENPAYSDMSISEDIMKDKKKAKQPKLLN